MASDEKDAYWFRHDSNARRDPKMMRLRAKHGAAGYGIFFMIVEYLRDQPGYRMQMDDIDMLPLEVGVSEEQLRGVLDVCFSTKLLVKNDGWFWAPSLLRRMEPWDAKREKLRQAGRLGGLAKAKANAEADALANATADATTNGVANAKQELQQMVKPPSSISVAEKIREDQIREDQREESTSGVPEPDEPPLSLAGEEGDSRAMRHFDQSRQDPSTGRCPLVKFPFVFLTPDELRDAREQYLKAGLDQDAWRDALKAANVELEMRKGDHRAKGGLAYKYLTDHILSTAIKKRLESNRLKGVEAPKRARVAEPTRDAARKVLNVLSVGPKTM